MSIETSPAGPQPGNPNVNQPLGNDRERPRYNESIGESQPQRSTVDEPGVTKKK